MNKIQKNKNFFSNNFFLWKNRKGFLLAEEVVKIIIAVIAIGLLSYLLFSLYNLNRTSNELELAESSLEHIVQELNSGRDEIEIFNPKGWWIVTDASSGEENLCICENPEKCERAGACLQNPNGFSVGEEIEIDKPPIILKINYGDKTISKN